jgi:signal transduction histidine kinase
MSFWQRGDRTPGWWMAAALGCSLIAVDAAGQAQRGIADAKTAYFLATMAVATLVGLWVWSWRTPRRMGKLMFWWPALVVMADLPNAYPESRFVSTIGLATLVFGYVVFAQMALSYPTGKLLPGALTWIYVFVLGYLAQAIQNLVNMLFWDLRGCPVCPPPHAPTFLYVGPAPFSLVTWNKGWTIFVMAILPIGLYVLYRAYAGASAGARRSLGPVILTATIITCTSWVYGYVIVTDRFSALAPLSWVQTTGALAAALTALLGLTLTKRARGSVGDLVVELERSGPGNVRPALAHAVGDPTLELALWLPEQRRWVDEDGRSVVLPSGDGRAVTYVGQDLAAIVHDPVLLDQSALLEATGSAVRFALENERLQAELRAQLKELRESRARIVRAGDSERRRLERDLHDGAQQRLLGVAMGLQMLRSSVPTQDEAASLLLDETEAEVQGALQELRELARGIHPAVLTDHGLAAAVRTLADRATIPVELDLTEDRLVAHVETAVYYIVAEALTNTAKHGMASHARVVVSCRDGVATVEIADDGVGGADLDGGSGLRGLADRVGALDGTLFIESQPGGGTRLIAEIPCAS